MNQMDLLGHLCENCVLGGNFVIGQRIDVFALHGSSLALMLPIEGDLLGDTIIGHQQLIQMDEWDGGRR